MSKKEKKFFGKEKPQAEERITGTKRKLPEWAKTPLFFFFLFLLIVVFYNPVIFGDKTIQSMDVLQNKALRSFTQQPRDGFTLWNPHLFCGMPAYTVSTSARWFDFTDYIYSTLSKIYSMTFSDYSGIYTFSFLLMGIGTFLLMRYKGASRGISIFTSMAVMFSSGLVSLFFSGHTTKLVALSVIPFLILLLFRIREKITITNFLLLVVLLHILVLVQHVQIVYYAVILTAIYFIYYFIHAFAVKDKVLTKNLLKTAGVLAAASVIALLMSYDTYSQLYQYFPYSTRNAQRAEKLKTRNVNLSKDDLSEDEDYKYSTNWSFSPKEMSTFIVPSFYGFGSSSIMEPGMSGAQEVNTYFGSMELVTMPLYMGIIVLMLAMFAAITRWKEPFVRFGIIVVLLFLFVSFGRNVPLLFDLFYKHLPGFRSFRVPSMILHIVQILIPVFAGLGLWKMTTMNDTEKKSWRPKVKYFAMVMTVLFLILLVTNESVMNWFAGRINSAAADNSQKSQNLLSLAGYASSMFNSDLKIAVFLLSVSSWLILLYWSGLLKQTIFITLIAGLSLFDLFRVGIRGSIYLEKNLVDNAFTNVPQVTAIKSQNDTQPFRIVDFRQGELGSINFNNNFYTYNLLEDLGGYSAAKPQAYEEIIKTVRLDCILLWRMLNVKYVVSDFPIKDPEFTPLLSLDRLYVYKNLSALPRAYFVDTVVTEDFKVFTDGLMRNGFDPEKQAFVDKIDFNTVKKDSTSRADVVGYSDNYIKLQTASAGDNFLFFGTTYLPFGWKAIIDGRDTKIYKANHGFMGIVVPAGKHEVEFEYAPVNFYIGKYITLILNILVWGALIAVALIRIRKVYTRGRISKEVPAE